MIELVKMFAASREGKDVYPSTSLTSLVVSKTGVYGDPIVSVALEQNGQICFKYWDRIGSLQTSTLCELPDAVTVFVEMVNILLE